MKVNDRKFINLLSVVLTAQIVVYVSMILDYPVVRQVFGFLYLAFVPGFVILKLLKLRKLDLTEAVVISLGLSIAFVMSIGLAINELGLLAGMLKPLFPDFVVIVVNLVVLLICFFGYASRVEDFGIDLSINISVPISVSKLCRIVPFLLLPFLGVVGASLAKISQNNVVLLLMILLISALTILITLSDGFGHSNFYSLILFIIAAALLFHSSLISNYVRGYDVNVEYYCFRSTAERLHWNSILGISEYPEYDRLGGMLSVTVLPTIFAGVLNMSTTLTLKIVYALIYSFVPLVLYQLNKKQFGKKVGLVSAFLFMANSAFFVEMLGLCREMVAELFFVLLLFVLLTDKIDLSKKSMLLIIFSFGLAVSHYSLSYIFMFYIFFTWASLYVMKKKSRRITATFVIMLFVILFSWYIYVSNSASFNGLIDMGNHVLSSLSREFFNPQSREQEVLRAVGMESAPSLWHLLGRVVAYATQFLILVGCTALITKRVKLVLPWERLMFVLLSMGILISCVVFPSFSGTLRVTRYYHTTLIFLSPMCILGWETLLSFLKRVSIKPKTSLSVLVLIVLVPYFLFQTGFVYEVMQDSNWSIPLSKYRMGLIPYAQGLIDESDVFGAVWLSETVDIESALIYADDMTKYTVLTSYGMVTRNLVVVLSNVTIIECDNIVYLRKMNLDYEVLFARRGSVENLWNLTEVSPVLNDMNKIYSNGGCEIYKAMYNQTR